jgi:hypothetical protein
MRLAAALLLLVACCHYGDSLLAQGYDNPEAAARAIFYILRGIEGVVLFAVIAAITRNRYAFAVCLFGMFEEGQTAICRAAKPIAERPAVELFKGLCGEPWYGVGLLLAALIAASMADKLREGRP